MTIEQRKQEFQKELQALLKKFDAELTLQDTEVFFMEANKEIVADFLLKDSDFPDVEPGGNEISKSIIAGSHILKLGHFFNGETD